MDSPLTGKVDSPLTCQAGAADGRGHTVGLASAERVLVDADPNCPAAIDLRTGAEEKLCRCLQCRGDQMLSLLIIQ